MVEARAWYDCVMQTQELLDRCEYTIKYQMQEIDRLRAELERAGTMNLSTCSNGLTATAMP